METSTEKKKPKLKLNLVGPNGNAFAVLGVAQKAARKAGWSQEEITKYLDEATAGDYNHLLATTMDYFDVT